MATIERFEDIDAWKESRLIAQEIYELTETGKFSRDASLKDQILRSSGSVMDNIAEGFERDGTKEFIQFLGYAKGSAGEVRSQLYRAYDRNYLEETTFQSLMDRSVRMSKMISGLMNYLKKSEFKGNKFK